ncbi:hypothetical protein N7G274_004743 [Stereocaulon virgatum]|uniref:Rhodopsin domain-containing protein n=1 Tax=Stereocaulon virgatum TaxID=373712 RepID=A0ABR4AAY4_9LECA
MGLYWRPFWHYGCCGAQACSPAVLAPHRRQNEALPDMGLLLPRRDTPNFLCPGCHLSLRAMLACICKLDPHGPHTCWNPKIVEDFSLFVGAYSAFTDFALASFPLVVIYNLQMSGKRRIAISVVMSLGVFAGICAIVRTTKLASLANYADWTWRAGDSIIWTAAEMNVIIICACVPALLPLVQQITGQKDYLDRPSRNTDDPVASRRPFWSIGLRSLKSRGTKNGLATRLETLDGNVRDGEIRHTTNIQTEWEAV